MAPKKPNPMEDPPAASSSEEEEEEGEGGGGSSSDEETSSDEEQLTQAPPKQASQKKPEIPKTATPQDSSDDEETGSDDSGSESDEPDAAAAAAAAPKPISSRPMDETPNNTTTTKPRSKPVPKRPIESDAAQKDSKRAKKKGPDDEETKKPADDTKKQLFQRLWSEDDEIVVLKGMLEFASKNGVDPSQDMQTFHQFIKKDLHVDVSRAQLMDKVRRLRKKYENNLKKSVKKGKDVAFSKAHERDSYDLSKRIWGSAGGGTSKVVETDSKPNGKAKKVMTTQVQKGNNAKASAPLKSEGLDAPKGAVKMDVDNDKQASLKNCVKAEENVLLDTSRGVAGLEEFLFKNGLDLAGETKRAEMTQRWNKLKIAQLEWYLERNDLMGEQARSILQALNSSNN